MDQYHDHYRDQQAGFHYGSGRALSKSYRHKQQQYPAYIFVVIVISVTVALVALDFIFNYWYYTYFYNALQSYNKHGLVQLLSFFTILGICYLVLALHRYFVSRLIGRQWLSNQMILALLVKYACLSNDFKNRKNYRRMQKDFAVFINRSLDFAMGLVVAITTFSAFMYYLYLLFDEIAMQFGLSDMTSYLFVTGCIFAIGGTIYLIKQDRYLNPIALEPSFQEMTAPAASASSCIHSNSLAKQSGLAMLQKNIYLWLLTGHSLIYVVFSLLLILPSYVEQLYLFLAVIYSLQTFIRGQHLFLFRLISYFKKV
jgi:hypothetical protein